MTFSTIHDSVQAPDRAPGRRLAPGIGLALGAAVSLGLWAGLIAIALRLIG